MKTPYIAVAIINVIIMVCWTALAIYFGKWWIALFSALCFSYVKTSHTNDKEEEENG